MPKILTKPVFAKEFILEKPAPKAEDEEIQKSALEEELRQTLNDLDLALNSTEVSATNEYNSNISIYNTFSLHLEIIQFHSRSAEKDSGASFQEKGLSVILKTE